MHTSHKLLNPVLFAVGICVVPGCYAMEDVLPGSPLEYLDQSRGAITNTAMPGGFDGYNDPSSIEPDYVLVFDDLPLAGALDKVPWTDTYWPKYKGGIADRWQTGENAAYRTLAPDEVAALTPRELKELSPAEKYDLYVGNEDWALAAREQAANQPTEAAWQGICHGWAPASLMYEEPQPVTVPSPSGRGIPFGSSDIKALLTYFQGVVLPTSYSAEVFSWGRAARGLGTACYSGRADDSGCHDINPGALHVLMSNEIGLRNGGFVLEVDGGSEKWNQPVYSFDTEVLGRRGPSSGSAEEAVGEVLVRSRVAWTVEIDPQWNALGAEVPEGIGDYHYTVELNSAGEVVGGQWLVPLRDGDYMTLGEAWDLLMQWDGPDDGDAPDLTRDEASEILWGWVEIPDFAWVMESSDFPSEFEQAISSYALLGGSITTRRSLHAYFAPLEDLYLRSIE